MISVEVSSAGFLGFRSNEEILVPAPVSGGVILSPIVQGGGIPQFIELEKIEVFFGSMEGVETPVSKRISNTSSYHQRALAAIAPGGEVMSNQAIGVDTAVNGEFEGVRIFGIHDLARGSEGEAELGRDASLSCISL